MEVKNYLEDLIESITKQNDIEQDHKESKIKF